MKKVFYSLIVVLCISGCTDIMGGIRYSPQELRAFPSEIQEQIKEGAISLNMTQTEVRYSWGAPSTVNVLKPSDGAQKEEWVYKSLGIRGLSKTTLTFTDSKLTDIVSTEPKVEKTDKEGSVIRR